MKRMILVLTALSIALERSRPRRLLRSRWRFPATHRRTSTASRQRWNRYKRFEAANPASNAFP